MKKLLIIGIVLMQSIILFGQVKVVSGGNVGIGVTSPIQKLQIDGNIFIPNGNSLWIGSSGDSLDRFRFHHSSTSAYIDYATGSLYFRAGTTTKLTLDANGNLGVGVTSPNNTLQVANLINFDSTYTNTFLGL
ncbi:MAG: hypothetical protein HY958_08960 [Bacteroidia bacterium]|nr:hypothetical protein [Bacteroidia bacterium]